MLKLKCIEKKQFDKYVTDQYKESHFMQSQSWGEFSKVYYNLTPYYLGLVNEKDELVAASLLLEKKLKMNYTGYFIPFGYVADFNKREIIKEMTQKIVEFVKNKKGLFIKINPNITKKKTNYLNENETNTNYQDILNNLKTIGFKHYKEDTSNTYLLDLEQTQEEIDNHISKDIKEKIKNLKLVITETNIGKKSDLKDLYNEKHNKMYYDTLYDIFNGNEANKATIIKETINIVKTINEHEKELKKINNQISIIPIDHLTKSSKDKLNTLTQIKKELINKINNYKTLRKEHGNDLVISTLLFIEHGNKVYLNSIKSDNAIKDNDIKYLAYYESIKYYKNNNIKELIQCEENQNIKKEFGGKKIEYIGEMEYIIKPITYFILNKILKII